MFQVIDFLLLKATISISIYNSYSTRLNAPIEKQIFDMQTNICNQISIIKL